MTEENKISLVVEGDYSSAFKFWILRKNRLYQPINTNHYYIETRNRVDICL